ncbi:MAG: arylamine N-acetyltransferase, partial [Lentisphaeria bacterium]|nr:arylamine N-acetyltransferase [Lentisphaeria bacterium]
MIDVDAYLKRIGYTGDKRPTITNLYALQKAHLTHVPYENLDLLYHHPGTLAIEDVYKKVVKNKRGGYCFELNGLFAELLRELGYSVTEYFGRWLLGESG